MKLSVLNIFSPKPATPVPLREGQVSPHEYPLKVAMPISPHTAHLSAFEPMFTTKLLESPLIGPRHLSPSFRFIVIGFDFVISVRCYPSTIDLQVTTHFMVVPHFSQDGGSIFLFSPKNDGRAVSIHEFCRDSVVVVLWLHFGHFHLMISGWTGKRLLIVYSPDDIGRCHNMTMAGAVEHCHCLSSQP